MSAPATLRFVPLAALRPTDAALAGGKAHALGLALAAGEPVPPGLILTPACLEAVLRPAELLDAWHEALAAARLADLGPAAALAPRVASLTWPPDVLAAVAAAAEALGETLAVRSSATAEDAPDASAAGVFHTELDVPSAALPAAASRCWAALLAPATLAHLLALGRDPAACRLALLIQPMLRPVAAGVLFTIDPGDPPHGRMRLAIASGAGAAVVEGEAGRDVPMPRRGRVPDVAGLPAGAARRLRDLGLRLEARAGRPLDIEWAWCADGLKLLQARPVPGQPPGMQHRPAIRWSRDLAEERFPDPISPLGWSALQSALRVNVATLDRRFGLAAARPDDVATTIGAYVYNNRDFFKIPGSLRFRAAAHRPFLGAYARALAPVLAPGAWKDLALALAPRRGPLASGPRDPRLYAVCGLFEAYVFAHAAEIEGAWTEGFPRHMAAMDGLLAEDPGAMDGPGRIAYARRLIAASDAFMEPDLAIYVVKMACRWLVGAIAAMVDGQEDPGLIATLTGGLTSNATLQMNAALDALVATAATDSFLSAAIRHGDLGALRDAWRTSPAQPLREGFLGAYGHLGTTWDLREPTWGERPEILDALVASRLRAGRVAPEAEDARRGELATARQAAVARLGAALAPAPWAPAFFERLIAVLHTMVRLDEEHHLFCGRLIPAERRLISVWAHEFTARGVLAEPDDIWFLTIDEVLAIAGEAAPHARAPLAARRRAAYERALAAPPVTEYVGDRPVAAEAVVGATSGQLKGEGASGGFVEGPVRHVKTLADLAEVRPGDIVVVPTPKPGYTPAWAVAGGVIAARGSVLSHGLILAREYGLPAITGVPDALDRLPPGTIVRLDGWSGLITVLTPAPAPVGG